MQIFCIGIEFALKKKMSQKVQKELQVLEWRKEQILLSFSMNFHFTNIKYGPQYLY